MHKTFVAHEQSTHWLCSTHTSVESPSQPLINLGSHEIYVMDTAVDIWMWKV